MSAVSGLLAALLSMLLVFAGVTPAGAAVPTPPAGTAVISVKVGGDRAADGSAAGLAGVQLGLYGTGTASTAPGNSFVQGASGAQYNTAWSWTTCVSDADGDCNFIIPIRAGAASATGVPQDTRFWVQQIGSSPAGWYSNPDARVGAFGATPEYDIDYRFRTDTQLRAGVTYLSTTPMTAAAALTNPDLGFMRVRADNNAEALLGANVTRTLGLWNQSRVNPALPMGQCGLNIAIVADTSGSLGASGIAALISTMDDFVDAFRGTPTTMSLFSFSNVSPGQGATNNSTPLPVTTATQAATFKAQYADWLSGGGTNWDRGLAAAANANGDYDLVVMLTDGNPTLYGPTPSGSSAFNALQDTDAGIFSANQLKSQGAHVIAVGVGPALTPASAHNLRAVSGTVEGEDYVLAADFDDASDYLASLASDCDSSIQVKKMIVPEGGTIAQATPGANWEMTASATTAATTIVGSSTVNTAADGTVNFGLSYTAPATSGSVQVVETQQSGYTLFPVNGSNAVCTNADTGAPITVTSVESTANPGFGVNTQQGVQVSCIIYNTPVSTPQPGFTLTKTSDPASGTPVQGGDTITYTVTGTNTGATVLDPVTITDDLSDVLNNASLTGTPTASAGSAPTLSGSTLTWNGTLAVGAAVTLTYTVTLDGDVPAGTVVNNHAEGSATPPGLPPITPPPVETEHPVPGFTLTKTSDPISGTLVNGGDTITYTVTGTNTGATELNPVTITDDMANVLNHAAYNGDATATVGGTAAGTVSVSGTSLTWDGALAPGAAVTITYSVTIDDDVPSRTVVNNHVEGSATPVVPPGNPPVPPITPPPVETEHPTPGAPGFTLTKVSDPSSGSAVVAGDTITYTVTGANTGDTDLDPVTITDDLSAVLNHASYNDDAEANIQGSTAGSLDVAGSTLTWDGALAEGETVTITYSVTIDDDVPAGTILNNHVEGSATPPTGPPITPPPVETEHPVPGFDLTKTSDPVSGSTVVGGDTITYTVTGTNTGATALNPVSITDDLSKVLNHATYNDDATATIAGTSAGTVNLSGDTLTWSGQLSVGAVVTITYSATIDADVPAGTIVNNHAEGSATPVTPPGSPQVPPITPPPVETEHPVPGFDLTKTSDPVSGSTVVGGDTITYTVTGTNTGATALDPVTISDDLTAVLNHATYNGDATATVDDVAAGTVDVSDDSLTWNGTLGLDEAVTITYSVTIDDDVPAGTIVNNHAEGSATPVTPPGSPQIPPITPPPVETSHPVPGFDLTKTSDPMPGSTVVGGDTITYTVTGTNTGATALDPVSITDDLSEVLNHATFNDDATATIGGSAAGTVDASGNTLTWEGQLAVGAVVTITYSVTIDSDVPAGVVVNNHAEGSATPVTPPGSPQVPPITPPPVETSHPVPGFEIGKSSDPIPGTLVYGGDTITYTVTGTNTGATALDPVTLTDDMSKVLNHATYNDDAVATIGGVASGSVALDGTTLTWTGSLAVGTAVTVTYSVTLDADVPAETVVHNHLEGSAQPPSTPEHPVPPITPPPVDTEHPTPGAPGFMLTKTSDPASGSTVVGGDTITYTVTGTNTGATVLNEVTIMDNLSGVLDNATISGQPSSSLGAAPVLTGSSLTWSGVLEVGQRVVLTYTVKLNGDVLAGTVIHNRVIGSATPPHQPPITPPPAETEHPVPGFTLTKTSNPASGAQVKGGDTITYTLTGTNTGATILDPVTITDDMSKVLNHAAITTSPVAKLNGVTAAAPAVTGTTLTWTGVLPKTGQVVITYTVTVDKNVPNGTVINNHVEGSAQPPSTPEHPVPPIVPPPAETKHTTPPAPGLAITGGTAATGVILVAVLLLGGGLALTAIRRRKENA